MGEKIILYKDQYSFIKCLTLEEAGRLMKAVFDYSAGGVDGDQIIEQYFRDADRVLSSAWGQAKEKLDYNGWAEAERSRKAKKAINTRWERERSSSEYDRIETNTTDDARIPTKTYNITNNNTEKDTFDELGNPKGGGVHV